MKSLSLFLSLVCAMCGLRAEGYVVKQSSVERPLLFQLVSNIDHTTSITGATPSVSLSKNGGAFAAPAGALSEIGNGWYQLAANATDDNTLGILILHATSAGADPSDTLFEVVAYDPQDSAALGLSSVASTNTTTSSTSSLATGIKAQTDRLLFDSASFVKSRPETLLDVIGTAAGQIDLLAGGLVDVGGYGAGEDPASLLLLTPGNKINTLSNGSVVSSYAMRKNTAYTGFTFFAASNTNHVSPAVGLMWAAQRSLDGGLFAACANTVMEIGSGFYTINLAASDLNANTVALHFTAPGADPVNLILVMNQ